MLQTVSHKETHPLLGVSDVVLDIETTGLRRQTDSVFLIGIQDHEAFTQWLAPTTQDEGALLEAAFSRLRDKTVITYNGDLFDLPFLKERAAHWQLPFPECLSEDWYAFFRKMRLFYRFANLKLKTLEQCAGVTREDVLSGAEVAKLAQSLEDPAACDAVLKHNADDVRGTTKLLPFFQAQKGRLRPPAPFDALLESFMIKGDRATAIYYSKKQAQPVWDLENSFGKLSWEEHHLTMTLPVHRIPDPGNPDALRFCAVHPDYAPDVANPPLPKPFITLSSPEGAFAENLHAMLLGLSAPLRQ